MSDGKSANSGIIHERCSTAESRKWGRYQRRASSRLAHPACLRTRRRRTTLLQLARQARRRVRLTIGLCLWVLPWDLRRPAALFSEKSVISAPDEAGAVQPVKDRWG